MIPLWAFSRLQAWCVCERDPLDELRYPIEDHPLNACRQPSALWGWSSRCFAAIRKDAVLCCGSRLRKGEVFAYVGRIDNLQDLKGESTETSLVAASRSRSRQGVCRAPQYLPTSSEPLSIVPPHSVNSISLPHKRLTEVLLI